MRKRRKGNRFMGIGLLLLAAALFLTAYNTWDGIRADRSAQEVNRKIQKEILKEAADGEPFYEETFQKEVELRDGAETVSGEPGMSDEPEEMAAIDIDGNLYIGVLEIPSLGLSLPVMADCDYAKLKIAPCRYAGSYYTDDLVIAGHNYRKHFSPIKWIEPGSDVVFTTAEGQVIAYTVDWAETVRPTEVGKLITAGDWDLTLFTCTTGGNARCAVRCVRK